MAKERQVRRNAATAAVALEQAESALQRPPEGAETPHYVQVKPEEIETLEELFQPRRFSAGLKRVDGRHVKMLARRIKMKGELDPPLLVKLRNTWVCVDGHHRVAAYLQQEWPGTIKCEWFNGSARQATDEGLRRNEVVKLEIPRGDRFEEAWKRVLNGWGSKRDIVQTCGVSDGSVALMRRVMTAHAQQNTQGKQLRAKLPRLLTVSWSEARMTYLNLNPAQWDAREAAAKLARQLDNRFANKRLAANPEVTAWALALYAPDLPEALMPQLEAVIAEMQREDEGRPPEETTAELRRKPEQTLEMMLADLKERHTRITGRARAIQQELARRKDEGATPSDLTWARWIEEAQQSETDDRDESSANDSKAG